jgi:Dihydrodipicolinate synthetase family
LNISDIRSSYESVCRSAASAICWRNGHGNVEQLTCLRDTLGDRLVYVGGMPTAEVFAAANRAIGVSTYSSAIFNFAPEYAQRFFAAIHSGDRAFASGAVRSSFIPYLALSNQRRGYAVGIVKAGLRVGGRPAGPVRAPLLDLTADQEAALAGLVARATGALARASKPSRSVDAGCLAIDRCERFGLVSAMALPIARLKNGPAGGRVGARLRTSVMSRGFERVSCRRKVDAARRASR